MGNTHCDSDLGTKMLFVGSASRVLCLVCMKPKVGSSAPHEADVMVHTHNPHSWVAEILPSSFSFMARRIRRVKLSSIYSYTEF